MIILNGPILYWLGLLAGLLLLSPVGYFFIKRSAATASPRIWFAVHVGATSIGAILALLHTGGHFLSPPGLLVALLAATIGLGAWIRLAQSNKFAARMGARPAAFTASNPQKRQLLGEILARKEALLQRLDLSAREAEFSPRLVHWARNPLLTLRYSRLAAREASLLGARHDAGIELRWSRPLHMAMGALFVAGLMVHFIVATWWPASQSAP